MIARGEVWLPCLLLIVVIDAGVDAGGPCRFAVVAAAVAAAVVARVDAGSPGRVAGVGLPQAAWCPWRCWLPCCSVSLRARSAGGLGPPGDAGLLIEKGKEAIGESEF